MGKTRKYARDDQGQFASTGGASKHKGAAANRAEPVKAPSKRSTAKNAALIAGAVLGSVAAAGVLQVRSDALNRYEVRTDTAALLRANSKSEWW